MTTDYSCVLNAAIPTMCVWHLLTLTFPVQQILFDSRSIRLAEICLARSARSLTATVCVQRTVVPTTYMWFAPTVCSSRIPPVCLIWQPFFFWQILSGWVCVILYSDYMSSVLWFQPCVFDWCSTYASSWLYVWFWIHLLAKSVQLFVYNGWLCVSC